MGSCLSSRIKAESPPHLGLRTEGVGDSNGKWSPRMEGEILQSTSLKSFTFNELKTATRNFRPDSVLGEGGFGCVFKGWINEQTYAAAKPGTGLVIAVKRLNQEGLQGHKEWLTEIAFLGQLYHPHVVKLIGFCLEDQQQLLVYEFMPRGSLDNHLFRRNSHYQPFSWLLRLKVAVGAAKGLAFLHSNKVRVIYRDFKTSNILLDSNYEAKLSDFGLAKDGPSGNESHVSTRVMGTHGYAAPEYLATGHLTTKSDVYSFGVVLLEMLSGRRVLDKNRPGVEQNLIEWAKPYLTSKRRIILIMDARIQGQYSSMGALKMVNLSLKCLSADPKSRPNMTEVVKALEQLWQYEETATKQQQLTSQQNPVNANSLKCHRRSASPIGNSQRPISFRGPFASPSQA
ncbi:hypothetical protein MLD38_009774 [Melastoma candidum]|uniref:Uncharacterized protein n=1 Tax=Melastoma candidum TaxID=119954 RepID=A0ACB9RYM6_9MYRT|nr:hypothetical protein MLD38_009774 [Melastoma candidum]